MSADTLSCAAGIFLSLLCSYIPGVKNRYDKLDGTNKRLVMLGLLLAVSLGVFSLTCAGWGVDLGNNLACSLASALGFVKIFQFALIANQATYSISPKCTQHQPR